MRSIQPGQVNGVIQAPTSKSMMQRVVALACLATTPTIIKYPSLCDDGLASLEIAKALGVSIKHSSDTIVLTPNARAITPHLDCNESGTSFRMFSALASLYDTPITVSGKGSLLKRSMQMVIEPLVHFGAKVDSHDGFPPLTITGPLKGGEYEVDGSESSQFVSGLLISLPTAINDSVLTVKNLKSRPYVELTLEAILHFGGRIEHDKELTQFEIPGRQSYRGISIELEGDWSGASFPLVAGAVGGKVTVLNLSLNSKQGDKIIVQLLKKIGASIEIQGSSIIVSKNKLLPFNFDATDYPDLFPPLVTLAAYCNGESVIKGVSRLFSKESNRADALTSEFKKLGISIVVNDDTMTVIGGTIHGGTIESHNDHRIAMACSIAAIGANDSVVINNPECVNKSYPQFFDHLSLLQGAS